MTCRNCGRPITQEPILRAWYHSGRPSARSFWCNPRVRFDELTGETLAEPVSRARPWRVRPSRHTGTPRAVSGDPGRSGDTGTERHEDTAMPTSDIHSRKVGSDRMRTDQFFLCEVCEWVITLCTCPGGPTVLLALDEDGQAYR